MRINRKRLQEAYMRSTSPPYIVGNYLAYIYMFKGDKYMVSWDTRNDKVEDVLGRFLGLEYTERLGFTVREVHVAPIHEYTKKEILEDILNKGWSPIKKDIRKKVSYRHGNKKVSSKY
ncbi:MAG: hypothetical protein J7K73_02660 [Nanoarchaeota archaeon]|nr:hypothetical protein [Nanoarchaeota archaeon]